MRDCMQFSHTIYRYAVYKCTIYAVGNAGDGTFSEGYEYIKILWSKSPDTRLTVVLT